MVQANNQNNNSEGEEEEKSLFEQGVEKLQEFVLEETEDGVPVYSMGVMDKVIAIARDNLQKYCFIRDISGKGTSGAASFFSYRGRLFELHNALIHVRAMED